MKSVLAVLRHEPRARWFLVANAQSAIGSGAALVGLMVLAYERMRSPWAITGVLLADFVPAMVLGPVFGAAADRWSRRGCAILADVLRAVAFVGIGVVDSFAATVALAVAAGVGTALFSPAILAALPTLASPERRAPVTSLYGVTRDLGRTLGPVLAAAAFPLIGAANLMTVNGITFALSALVIALVPFGGREPSAEGYAPTGLLREAGEGLREVWRIPGVRVVLWASTAIIVFAAMINVGELLLARDVGAGDSGFAVLVASLGVGVVAGSLAGSRGGSLREMKPRYLIGLLLVATALLGMAASPNYGVALVTFFAMGLGNGLVIVHERLIFHAAVGDRLMARAFALLDMLGGWGFAAAFLGAGALISAVGTRSTFAIAGAGGVVVWALAAISLRNVWQAPAVTARAAVDTRD